MDIHSFNSIIGGLKKDKEILEAKLDNSNALIHNLYGKILELSTEVQMLRLKDLTNKANISLPNNKP